MEDYVKSLSAAELLEYTGEFTRKAKTPIKTKHQIILLKFCQTTFLALLSVLGLYFSWLPAAKLTDYDWLLSYQRVGLIIMLFVWSCSIGFIIWGLIAEDKKLFIKLYMPLQKWENYIQEVEEAQKDLDEWTKFAEENEEFLQRKINEYHRTVGL